MAKATKTKAPAGVKRVTVDIRTKGDHKDLLDWQMEQLPDIYSGASEKTDSGYKVAVMFETEGKGTQFFVSRYLANIAAEIRTLDEGNIKVETLPVTIETESAE